jgi:hypothetical protein
MQVKYLNFDSTIFNFQFSIHNSLFRAHFKKKLLSSTYWKISKFWFYIFQFTVHCLEHISKGKYYFKCIEKYWSKFWFDIFQFTGLCSNPISKYPFKLNAGEIFMFFVHNFRFTILCLEHISKKNYYFKYIEKCFDSTNYNSQSFVQIAFQRLHNHLNWVSIPCAFVQSKFHIIYNHLNSMLNIWVLILCAFVQSKFHRVYNHLNSMWNT